MIDFSKIPEANAKDTALALGAVMFALGVTFPSALGLQVADALRACARIRQDDGYTSAGTLIEALADAMAEAARMSTPPH